MSECQTCVIVDNRKSPDVPVWDSIFPSKYFDITHAYNSSLPGWIVVVSKRHIAAVDELSERESVELGTLIRKVSIALKLVVGCTKTYVMQFAAKEGHQHVHFHIVPRMADIESEDKGPNVFNLLGVGPDLCVPESQRNEIGLRMREIMEAT